LKPILLNLLAEEQHAERASAHDPVKTAVLIAVVVLALTAAAGSVVNKRAGLRRAAAAALQKRYDSLTNQVAEGSGDLRTWKSLATDLAAMNNSRILFARQMALIKNIVPDTIQLVHVSVTVSTEAGAPPPEAGSEGGKRKRVARALNTERLLLHLEGRTECARPEMEVDHFIKTLQTDPVLKLELEQVQLRSIARSAPAGGPESPGLPAAQFVIDCRYKARSS
jgi:hypothetical protein